MLTIKADKDAIFNNIVDILDEVLINAVKKYAIVKISNIEARYLDILGKP